MNVWNHINIEDIKLIEPNNDPIICREKNNKSIE